MSFPRYPKYKPSGVEWLGDVPEHWEVKRLRHCLQRMASGGTPESGRAEYWSSEEGGEAIPWVSIGDMTRNSTVLATERSVTRVGLESKQLEVFPVGTLLYSMYASLGKVAQLGVPAAVNQAILALQAEPASTDQSFLRQWLGFLEPTLGYFASSNTQENLNAAKVRSLPLALPPLPEQQAIAAFLDRETAKIDGLVAEQQRLIEILKEKRQAVISHAVTKGLDPKAPMKPSGVEWLGDVPAHWEVKRLRRGITRIEQGWSPECDAEIADEGAWGVLKTGCTNHGRFEPSENKALPPHLEPRPELEVQEGDLLMSRASGSPSLVGSCALVGRVRPRLMLSDKIFRLHLADSLSPAFAAWALGSLSLRHQIQRSISGADGLANNLPQSSLLGFTLAVPPIQEQRLIATFLDRETAKIDGLVAEATTAITLLQERRSALISAAVTGQIDVRNAVATEAA
jgi:type I restriction enzyme, S subunit